MFVVVILLFKISQSNLVGVIWGSIGGLWGECAEVSLQGGVVCAWQEAGHVGGEG